MNHGIILKKAFDIVLHNRFLWFLGILVGVDAGSNFFRYTVDSGDWQRNLEKMPDRNLGDAVSANVKGIGQVLGEKIQPDVWSNSLIITVIVLLLCLSLLIIYLTITSKGALVWSGAKLDKGDECSFGAAWKFGHKFFWRRLSFSIIISAVIIILTSVLASPVIVLAIFEYTIPAIILGVLLCILLIVLLVYLALILPYAERILFLENKKTTESLVSANKLFRQNFGSIIVMYLILMGIKIGYAMVIVVVFLFVGLLVFGLSALIYLLSHSAAFIFGGAFIAVFVFMLIILGGAMQAFYWTAITLIYKNLK